MSFFVYLLESESNGNYYVGQTNNMDERMERHNSGREKYTSVHRPWRLVGKLEKSTRSEAVILERKLKQLS